MSGRLAGHVALVTGAAGGIGGAIVRRFAREECRVIAVDRNMPQGGDLNLIGDVGDDDGMARVGQQVTAASLEPSIVVHAAGIGERRPTLETDGAMLAKVTNVNVGGAFRLARLFAPAMRARRRGAFLFLSSINSTFATPELAAYAASKAALDSFTRTLALELAADQVRVNAIRPASIETPLLTDGFARHDDPAAARAANVARHPLGRLGTPDDVAALATFLCSDEASWITGADYLLDGGASITRR